MLPLDWEEKVFSYDWLYSFTQEPHAFSPAIGNGYLATMIFSDSVYIAGVYNGNMTDYDNPSHRARVPSTLNITVTSIDGKPAGKVDCALDLEAGRYIERFNGAIEQTIYAHREHKTLLVHEMKSLGGTHKVCIQSDPGNPSADINFTAVESDGKDYRVYAGWTQLTEWPQNPKRFVVMATSEPVQEMKTDQTESWEKCIELDSTKDPVWFYTVIEADVDAKAVAQKYEEFRQIGGNLLMESHIQAWKELRQKGASIHLEGFSDLAKATNSSIYELLISMREDVPWSNSPGGLATNFYNGHIFWDFETWMYPALLVMYPSLARTGLEYRLNHIEGAQKKAKDNKYLGAMWPWESAYSGDETTPTSANTGKMEHHISGDIVFAARQFDYLHRDPNVREKLLCPLAVQTAEYWASRVEKGDDGMYHIAGVIPPDEYVENVTDNIYTNEVAGISLRYANECRKNDTWIEIADKIYIDYDAEHDYHPEYVGYKIGSVVKQADVILVSFPLGGKYNTSTLLNDLLFYETATARDGPAMTWSMFFVDSLELVNNTEGIALAAYKYLYKSFLMNMKGPYYVWWEAPEMGALHFSTGAGGFLQGMIFGHGGLRIHYDPEKPNILARLKPVLPIEPVEKVELRGLNLLGGKVRLDVKVEKGATFVRTQNEGLYLLSEVKGKFDLKQGEWVEVPSNIGLEDKEGFYIMSNGRFLNAGGLVVLLIIALMILQPLYLTLKQ
eukprot:TRINITY_DN8460_c0_g1_i2.p1 TRINITY_DN8460_c0_g1~~TRINITY_DN8460_c0_g1_i2.p1  ORF type:complete len:729 (+),score=78.46 TRINITY_DN8460_c0_g1_i2:210-2396(+)